MNSAAAIGLDAPERRAVVAAAARESAKLAGQAIRLKIDRLNVDRGWAVVVGAVEGVRGKQLDWTLTECSPDLDRMLWVVLRKARGAWHVEQLDICASEPPYWYLDQSQGLVWPCGVYAGLTDGNDDTLESRCRDRRRTGR